MRDRNSDGMNMTRSQMMLPMLSYIDANGGSAKASEVIDAVAHKLGVPDSEKNDFREVDCGKWGSRKRSNFRQSVHWARMDAVMAGYLEKREKGVWTLSEKGRGTLVNCQPGVILFVYETAEGQVFLSDAVTAAGALTDDSVNLVFSSSPYPILNGRGYGTFTEAEIVELLVKCAHEWKRALTPDGSLVLNLKDCWLPKAQTGGAVRSLYQEKLLIALSEDVGLHFADRLYYKNPSHLPDNPWITIKKVRLNNDVENLFWFGKSPNPYANNQNVLVDAAPSTVAAYLSKAKRAQKLKVGPSGHNNLFEDHMAAVAAGQSLKVIPRNLLEFSNADPKTLLTKRLKELGLPKHDATMPLKLAEFFIKFLTRENDLVYDGFFGSGTTGVAAQTLKRRFLGSDRSLAHLLGSALRFDNVSYGPEMVAA